IRSGALSPSNLLASCLKRIDAAEPTLKAWVHLDRDAAARVAVQRDIEAREGRFVGPLHGVPVALKDIYDAAGLTREARPRGRHRDRRLRPADRGGDVAGADLLRASRVQGGGGLFSPESPVARQPAGGTAIRHAPTARHPFPDLPGLVPVGA